MTAGLPMSLRNRLAPLRSLAEQAGRGLLDAFYPLECVGCGNTGKVICEGCSANLSRLSPPFCRVCAAPGAFSLCPSCAVAIWHFDGIRAPFRYEGVIRQAILAFKYNGIKAAAPQLGALLADYLQANPLPGDVLAAVPMHPSRRRERGYNQAELLARQVSRRCGLPYMGDLLVRTRRVDPQAGTASAAHRVANVANSVGVGPAGAAAGTRIILIDDVATTGNTLETCAQALERAGAESVWGLTLAVASGLASRE